ncbi:MAG: type I methionyl aminopeptidase [Clostridiaceae bacterium]|jgi:methionyl aminopeptidase|nr:type I methionyl aminopeptidase [Clostridiaceae bacterium]
MIVIKTAAEVDAIRASGMILREVFTQLEDFIRPGVTTEEINYLAEETIRSRGAIPSFLNYGGGYGIPPFPAAACISVNDEIIHGIPSERRLESGDVVSVDLGACLDGWHSDACRTYAVGDCSEDSLNLIATAEKAFHVGLAKIKPGNRLGDMQAAVYAEIVAGGCDVVRNFSGHGIGRSLHEDPVIYNYGQAGRGVKFVPGMVFCLEPMIAAGSADYYFMDDGWTVRTRDGSWAAHYENTIAVTETGAELLTCGEDCA